METTTLQQEFEYYRSHQAELVEKYGGKVIVIKDRQVIGSFDSEMDAIEETKGRHPLGTFLVQKCEPGEESYTQTYHSRVYFHRCQSPRRLQQSFPPEQTSS